MYATCMVAIHVIICVAHAKMAPSFAISQGRNCIARCLGLVPHFYRTPLKEKKVLLTIALVFISICHTRLPYVFVTQKKMRLDGRASRYTCKVEAITRVCWIADI